MTDRSATTKDPGSREGVDGEEAKVEEEEEDAESASETLWKTTRVRLRPLKRVNTSNFLKVYSPRDSPVESPQSMSRELLQKVKQEDITDEEAAKDLVQVVSDKNDKLIDAMIEDKTVTFLGYVIDGGNTYIADNILRVTRDSLIEV